MTSAARASSAPAPRGGARDLGLVHGRVQDVAFLAARATDKDAAGAFGVVLRHRPGALGGLVVGVGVDAQQAKLIGHPTKIWGELLGSSAVRVTAPYDGADARGLYFHQLLAGRDFAAGDQFATTMRNHVYVIGDAATGEVVLVDPAYDVPALLGWVAEAVCAWPGYWRPTTTPTTSAGTFLASTSRGWSTCWSWRTCLSMSKRTRSPGWRR